jgi:hypothetical protein
MSPYSGLFDLLEKKQFVTKEGNRYCYTDLSGEIHKYFRKEWNRNTNGILDVVMAKFHEQLAARTKNIVDVESDEE